MKLITEMSYDFELYEDKNNKDMFAVGIFSSAELKNNNKRIYKRNLLEREVEKVQEKVGKKCLWGELGHPPNPEVNPDKIAIRTTQLEWKGNDLYGKAKILDTPMGQIAKTLVKEGQMGISSRGLGTVGDDGYVNEDFHLITWDLVTDPSNNPSWVNGIFEGQTFTLPSITNSITGVPNEQDIKKAQKVYFNHLMNVIDDIGEYIGESKWNFDSSAIYRTLGEIDKNIQAEVIWKAGREKAKVQFRDIKSREYLGHAMVSTKGMKSKEFLKHVDKDMKKIWQSKK